MKLCQDVLPFQGLRHSGSSFWCPYCERTWERGGHKEGFVKASASRHVYGCWAVGLYLRGYMIGNYTRRGDQALPLDKAKQQIRDGRIHPRYLRAVKAAVAQRRRDGTLDKLQPQVRRKKEWV